MDHLGPNQNKRKKKHLESLDMAAANQEPHGVDVADSSLKQDKTPFS
uniref:Uncharacterized protein n=1 Tax=Nelumbo nucifera TaxID=4432 RepID=A0A822ZNC0_NELNU|nr:TPA_asm: hypothetical protein HUJ06_002666 [Nelumbo nucifera]